MKRIIEQRITNIIFAGAFVVLSAVFYFSFKSLKDAQKAHRWAAHMQQLLPELDTAVLLIHDIELSRFSKDLKKKPQQSFQKEFLLKATLDSLCAQIDYNNDQADNIYSLKKSVSKLEQLLSDETEILKQYGADSLHLHHVTFSDTLYAEIEKKISAIKNRELALLASRTAENDRELYTSSMYFIIQFIIICFILVAFFIITKKSLKKIDRANFELLNKNSELEASEEQLLAHLDQISDLQRFLEERERQYRELIENASDMIYELDENGAFSFANPLMENVSGFSLDELKHKRFIDLVYEGHKERLIKFYNDQRKERKDTSYYEFIMVTRYGEKLWIGQNVRMTFSNAKNSWVSKVSVVARDISELKRVQTKLTESETLYRMLSETSQDMIALTDLDGKYVYVSGSVKKMLGYTPEELI